MRYALNKATYNDLLNIIMPQKKLNAKDLKYAGSIYNLLFTKDSNISFECIYTKMSDINDNREFMLKFERAFQTQDKYRIFEKQA